MLARHAGVRNDDVVVLAATDGYLVLHQRVFGRHRIDAIDRHQPRTLSIPGPVEYSDR